MLSNIDDTMNPRIWSKALSWWQSGVSVVPLVDKRPPRHFDLKTYLNNPPTAETIRGWFDNSNNYPAYGVICGVVSGNLFVLDFDNENAYPEWRKKYPELAQTYTVRTKRGYHVYLRSTGLLHGRKFAGGDLRANGQYVVGAGSVVKGHTYTVIVHAPIQTVSEKMLPIMLCDLAGQETNEINISDETNDIVTLGQLDTGRLIRHYQKSAPVVGRNNALYRAGRLAQSTGVSLIAAYSVLGPIHAQTQAFWEHDKETDQQRSTEALATLTSAYKSHVTIDLNNLHLVGQRTAGLPNSIREALMKHANDGRTKRYSTITARFLDALHLKHYQPDTFINTDTAIQIGAQYGIARTSVLSVLSGRYSLVNGYSILPMAHKPIVLDSDNRRFNSGAPEKWYKVPSIEYLCKILEIDAPGLSDQLQPEDLRSSKAYREALHRELIKRQSPELSLSWHAERLSVCPRTIRRYNENLNVIVTPVFSYSLLTWDNVEAVDDALEGRINKAGRTITPGLWLQREDGKRYPAIRGIAYRLLGKKERVVRCERLPNRLQLPDVPIVVYPVIWRNLETQIDWGGGAYDFPPVNDSIVPIVPFVHSIPASVEPLPPDWEQLAANEPPQWVGNQSILPPKSTVDELPESYWEQIMNDGPPPWLDDVGLPALKPQKRDDLEIIKGVSEWRVKLLHKQSIYTYRQLVQADPENISMSMKFVTKTQARWWQYQAERLDSGLISDIDLAGWRYKEWQAMLYDTGRLGKERNNHGRSERFIQAVAKQFIEDDLQKYRPTVPAWFLHLVDEKRKSQEAGQGK